MRVDRVEQVAAPRREPPGDGLNRLSALRRCAQRVAGSHDLDSLVEGTLDGVVHEFGIRHAMLLMLDAAGQRLYTVASRGYGRSGAGSEIPLGEGVVGVAARMGTPIRINHATLEYAYSRTMREGLSGQLLEREIPLPGLAEPGSQLAVPLACGGQLLGVLFVESPQDMRFSWDDEDALVALAAQVARAGARPAGLCRRARRRSAGRRGGRAHRAGAADGAAARAPLRGRRQRLPRRRLPDQGRGRRGAVEAAARPRRRAAAPSSPTANCAWRPRSACPRSATTSRRAWCC